MKSIKNIKRSIWCLSIILAFSLAVPMVATAAQGSGSNISMEFRYAEGGSPDVPDSINQFGIEYRLVQTSAPMLESSLPISRVYNYRINGALSEADLAQVANIPGLTLTEVKEKRTKKVDQTAQLQGLPTNDVDALTESPQYLASIAGMAGNGVFIEGPALTGVTFEVTSWEGGFVGGLPETYKADYICRGVVQYEAVAYYLAEMNYSLANVEAEENQYIVVAEYEPTNLPIPIDEEEVIEEEEDDDDVVVPVPAEYFAGLTDSDLDRMGNQSGNPFVDLMDGNVPLGNGNVKAGVSLISGLLSIIAVVLLVMHISTILAIRKKRDDIVEYDVDEEQAMVERRRKNAFLTLICVVSALVPVVWLTLDNVMMPFVWVNAWTVFVAVCFIVDVILIGLYKVRFRAVDTEESVEVAI